MIRIESHLVGMNLCNIFPSQLFRHIFSHFAITIMGFLPCSQLSFDIYIMPFPTSRKHSMSLYLTISFNKHNDLRLRRESGHVLFRFPSAVWTQYFVISYANSLIMEDFFLFLFLFSFTLEFSLFSLIDYLKIFCKSHLTPLESIYLGKVFRT